MNNVIKPQAGPQTQFLSTKADICLYGGSAGGGKSFALLLEALRHSYNRKFTANIFRRNSTMIMSTGGLWSEAMNLFLPAKAHPREHKMDFTFTSGAKVKFSHLEHDNTIYSYQGSQICYLGFDELTHFTEAQFFYLLSRNRSVCGVRPYVRATTNPDKDSWVRRLVDWWIDKQTGYPIPERSGVLRYFIRLDEKLIWGDSKEELAHYGIEPKSFTFIPAKLTDNQILMENDPGYIANLHAQNRVEKERLLHGNWNISYGDFGSVISRNDFGRFNLAEKMLMPGFWLESYFVVDCASRTKEANDYSVILLMAKSRLDHMYYIIDLARYKLEEPDLEQLIIDKWTHWRANGFSPKGVNIERGSCGIGMMQRLPRKGIPVFELKPEKDKFLRLNDNLGVIKSRFVNIPDNASWADKFIEECECFRADMKHVPMEGESKPHDDQVDVLAYGLSTQVNKNVIVSVYLKPKEHKPRHGLGLGLWS